MSKLTLAAALVAASSLCALPAQAAGHRASERIFYSDLDLATPQGAREMLKRITETAVELCAPSRSPVIVRPATAENTARCRAEAIERAVARLQAPMVTAEYDRIRLQQHRMAAAH